jgi:hypothetical protein
MNKSRESDTFQFFMIVYFSPHPCSKKLPSYRGQQDEDKRLQNHEKIVHHKDPSLFS